MSSSAASSPPPTNPVLSAYESFVSETPLVTRYSLTTYTLSWLISPFLPLHHAIINIPYFTIFNFELYRLILSNFLCLSILNLIFGYFSFINYGKRLEYSMGSTNFAALLLSIGAGTNILFTFLTLILYIITGYKPFMMSQSGGLWQVIYGIIAMECSFAPEGSKRRLFVVDIPTLYYPFALWGLVTMLASSSFLERMADLVSIGIGYAYGFGKLEFLKISLERRRRLEAGVLRSFTSKVGWVVGPTRDAWVMVSPGNNTDEEQGWAPSIIRTRESSIPTSTLGNRNSNTGQRLGGSASGGNNNNNSNTMNSTNATGTATRRSNITSSSSVSTTSSSDKQSAREKLLAAAEQRAIDKKRNSGEE